MCELDSEPQLTLNWHELGRYKSILDLQTRDLRRISLRIQPWGSRPLNLNFLNHFLSWTSEKSHVLKRKKTPLINILPIPPQLFLGNIGQRNKMNVSISPRFSIVDHEKKTNIDN